MSSDERGSVGLAERSVPRRRSFVARFGWRAYALPVLVVVTVVALATGNDSGRSPHAAGSPVAAATRASIPPTAAASQQIKVDRPGANARNDVLRAAALPAGPAYTLRGDGTFRVLPGSSPVVGSGPLHRYDVEVENGVTGVDLDQFSALVTSVLDDPRSWSGHGVSLQRVSSGPVDFHVSLTSALTVRTLCGYELPVETSCYDDSAQRVVMNVARWVRGAAAYVGDVAQYRVYMINHEDGHALGHQHAHECLAGGVAPAMMQQTLGLKSTTGQLCQANPWPFPPGVAGAPGVEAPDTAANSESTLVPD